MPLKKRRKNFTLSSMNFEILSLFPEMFDGFLKNSIVGRAQKSGKIKIEITNFRDFSKLKNRKVDDEIYGGGAGLLLRPEPISAAIDAAKKKSPDAKVIFLSPTGRKFDQKMAEKIAAEKRDLILICGRYEGLDARVRETLVDEEIAVGDAILTGGEIPAAFFIDAVSRLLDGVVGDQKSVETESFSRELFRQKEFPQFTRTEKWRNKSVPKVLKSGNHKKIENWNFENIPDLSPLERKMLKMRREHLPQKSRNLLFRMPKFSDIDFWLKWVNDFEVCEKLILDPPFSRDDEIEFFEMAIGDLTQIIVAIDDRKTKKPLGIAHLQTFPLNSKAAEFGILIGEKDFWGRGLGTEITQKMLKIAFSDLKLEKVVARVFVENAASRKILEKCGFREIGIFKREIEKSDGFHDCVFFEKLRDEF